MDHERCLRVLRNLALLDVGLGGCHRTAETQAQDPPRPSRCPASEPQPNASCASPGRAACEHYSGPEGRRSLRARCTCERAGGQESPRWSCQAFATCGPLARSEAEAMLPALARAAPSLRLARVPPSARGERAHEAPWLGERRAGPLLSSVLLGAGALLSGCARGGRNAPAPSLVDATTQRNLDATAHVTRSASPDAAARLCTAVAARAQRLQPALESEPEGVELASGTSLQVLGLAVDAEGAPRQRGVGTVFRVRAGAAEGYATLGPTELSSACPVVFPEALLPPAPATEEELARHHGADREHALRAAYRAEVGPDGVPLRPLAIHPVTRADVDGDGVLDEVVRIDTALGARSALQLVLLQGAHGVAAFRVGAAERSDGADDLEEDCGEPLAVSGAFYLVRTRRERVGEAPQPVVARTRYTLLRCRRGGPCVSVGSAFTTFGGAERWTFEEGDLGGVRVRSSLGRAQTLRWDEASFRLRL